MNGIYDGLTQGFKPVAVKLFSTKRLNEMLRKYFGNKVKQGEVPKELWEETTAKLQDAIAEIKYTDRDDDLIEQLKENVSVFSAFKSYRQNNELLATLVDENGNRRSWNEFRKAAQQVNKTYNERWLETEYNLATRQARAAVQWKDFEADADVFPNLKYMPTRSAEPDEAHVPFYGVIKPIKDPFWNTHFPPNGYKCQCGVSQTDEAASDKVFEPLPPMPGISGNAGKTGQVFSKTHPYMDVSKEEKKAIEKQYKKLKNG